MAKSLGGGTVGGLPSLQVRSGQAAIQQDDVERVRRCGDMHSGDFRAVDQYMVDGRIRFVGQDCDLGIGVFFKIPDQQQ